jgi:hypothetical protein
MKKTEYFIGSYVQHNQIESSIKIAINRRDEFIEKNKDSIGKVDCEAIQIVALGNTNTAQAIISLSYYPKK